MKLHEITLSIALKKGVPFLERQELNKSINSIKPIKAAIWKSDVSIKALRDINYVFMRCFLLYGET
jgi:hypothetical protein